MSVFDLFSKRQKRLRGEVPDTYRYDQIPQALRVQIVHILNDLFGEPRYESPTPKAFAHINSVLCREYGTFKLVKHGGRDPREDVFDFILQEENVERVLDALEISMKTAATAHSDWRMATYGDPALTPTLATEELNQRFREHAIGFQLESGQVVRTDSQFVHQEVVRPAIHFISEKRFAGANDEFLSAHAHYRAGRTKECLVDCLKALESTLKVI
jgi:hypothetical protein